MKNKNIAVVYLVKISQPWKEIRLMCCDYFTVMPVAYHEYRLFCEKSEGCAQATILITLKASAASLLISVPLAKDLALTFSILKLFFIVWEP